MNFLEARKSIYGSCTDISSRDEQTDSTEYHTLTDDEDATITESNYDTLSEDFGMDLDGDGWTPSPSGFQTFSSDLDSDIYPIDQSKKSGNPEYECKICVHRFSTLQECLRHELLEHSNGRTGQKSPQKSVRTSLSHLLPAFENTNNQADRARIRELFQKCRPGMELQELFNIYCISEEKAKQIVTDVNFSLLKVLWPPQYFKICTFGSCENGLMMWDSDIDMYVTMIYTSRSHGRPSNKNEVYNRVNSHLRRSNLFDEIISVRRARVPIIKCRHLATGMRIDINCSCPNSVVNTAFLRDLMHFDGRIHSFMRFMKVWAKQMWIVRRNRMSSYCLCMLALFYLQQPRNYSPPLVPPIYKLQQNVPPQYVLGVNYAFDLNRHMKPIPTEISTSSLIRGFFKFYRNFDFVKQMIVPYVGGTISLEDFRSGKYKFLPYLKQLNAMKKAASHTDDPDVEELSADKVMVVQDAFQLNQNVSRGIHITQLEYFRKCIEYGYHISMDGGARTDRQFYEALLFEIIGNMENEAQQLRICTGQNTTLTQPHEMMYTFTPCRAEIRALTAQQLSASLSNGTKMGSGDTIYQVWTRHYIEAIYVILTHVYCLDVKILNDNDDPYDERLLKCNSTEHLDNDSSYDRSQIVESFKQLKHTQQVQWILSSSLDTWSERIFQRESTQTFMSFQYAQTQKFLEQRRGKPPYDVKFLGRFTLTSLEDSKTLELMLKQHQQTQKWFCKKEPMRKFFTNFKCGLQNFNLKEKLQAESGHRYGMPSKSCKDLMFWLGVASEMDGVKSDQGTDTT